MSSRSQSSPKRGASKRFAKSTREKKTKEKKKRAGAKYLAQEAPQATPQETADKTLASLGKLGSQVFALSPFSQYYDDWQVNLRQVLSEFEANPNIKVDEQFIKERDIALQDLQDALTEKRLQEASLTQEAKALADVNHKIADADRTYQLQTRELSDKRNSDVQRLSNRIRELEDDVAAQQQVKLGFFKFKDKRLAAEKLAQTNRDLTAAKTELEVALQNFKTEQEKLHDNYEKQKQDFTEASDRLHKELEKLETDTSAETRQTACDALSGSINALLKRILP